MALMRLHYGTAVFALYPYESLYGDVAQLARAPALQAVVVGSSPIVSTRYR